MRAILLLPLLMVAACSTSRETFPREDGSSGLSLAPRNPNIPLGEGGDLDCPGGLARGSRIDEYRDGSASLFCD